MVIDNKGRLFGKVNIIDLIIVLILVAAVALIVPKFVKSGTVTQFSKSGEIILLDIFVDEFPEYSIKDIKKGDIVKDPVRSSVLGKVVDIKTGPSVSYAGNDKGEIIKGSREGYLSATITVEAVGIINDRASQGGVTIDNVDQFIGRTQEFRIGHDAVYGRISSFKEKE